MENLSCPMPTLPKEQWSTFAFGLLFLAAGSLAGQIPDGAQFQVNNTTTGNQTPTGVSRIGSSDQFVVVWHSATSAGTDTDGGSIQMRLVGPDGAPVSSEFQVNTYTTSDQSDPRVAGLPDADFLVVWRSQGSFGSDSDAASIQGRLFDGSGAPRGDQFQINTETEGQQFYPEASVLSDGKFIVVWGRPEIEGQLLDSDGTPLGPSFRSTRQPQTIRGLAAVQ